MEDSKSSTAKAIPLSSNATIEYLAQITGLDPNESEKWLLDFNKHGVGKANFNRQGVYTIPNTVTIIVGEATPSEPKDLYNLALSAKSICSAHRAA